MDYQYKILSMNEKERWIMITSNDNLDREEPDAFVNLIKKIQTDVNGTVKEVGDIQYKITGDGYGFIYQWDRLFGITVIYPKEVTKVQALNFLSKYMSEF